MGLAGGESLDAAVAPDTFPRISQNVSPLSTMLINHPASGEEEEEVER